MRSGIRERAGGEFGLHGTYMQGQAEHPVPGAAGEVMALDTNAEEPREYRPEAPTATIRTERSGKDMKLRASG